MRYIVYNLPRLMSGHWLNGLRIKRKLYNHFEGRVIKLRIEWNNLQTEKHKWNSKSSYTFSKMSVKSKRSSSYNNKGKLKRPRYDKNSERKNCTGGNWTSRNKSEKTKQNVQVEEMLEKLIRFH